MKTLVVLLLVICFHSVKAQETVAHDSLRRQHFLDIINIQHDQSYITAAGGIGSLDPLIFEGRLSPFFFIADKQKKWAFMISPQVQARMEDKKSVPIPSPGYKIHAAISHELALKKHSWIQKLLYDQALISISADHHSNGKDGLFYKFANGRRTNTIDLEKASFTTNFGTLTFSSYQMKRQSNATNAFRYARLMGEVHVLNTDELNDLYGNYRITAAWGTGGTWRETPKGWANLFRHSSLELQTGWIAGKKGQATAGNVEKRLWVDARITFYPEWFKEIAFFARYYYGQDYYNIYFSNTLYLASFGITSNLMNLKQTIKVLGEK